ncbi:MAG: nucleotidyltransferase family protein [Desulfomonilaceae bacterium]|nr:nucleotidyltransferase family protein [Desulfomonilaceae bacterium]
MIHGIILAAGLSTRMGVPKLLMPLDGSPILSHVLQAALDSSLDRVILVAGPGLMSSSYLRGLPRVSARLRVVTNPRPQEGMSSSLRVGMAAMDPNSQGVMVILADQPRLTHTLIDELKAVFLRDPSKIVAPAIHGRRTTPVIFPASLFDELTAQRGDVGGRDVVTQNLHKVVEIEMGSYYDDADIDTPEDLRRVENGISDRRRTGRPVGDEI